MQILKQNQMGFFPPFKILPPSSGEVGFPSEMSACLLCMWKHLQLRNSPQFFMILKLITLIAHDDVSSSRSQGSWKRLV